MRIRGVNYWEMSMYVQVRKEYLKNSFIEKMYLFEYLGVVIYSFIYMQKG